MSGKINIKENQIKEQLQLYEKLKCVSIYKYQFRCWFFFFKRKGLVMSGKGVFVTKNWLQFHICNALFFFSLTVKLLEILKTKLS